MVDIEGVVERKMKCDEVPGLTETKKVSGGRGVGENANEGVGRKFCGIFSKVNMWLESAQLKWNGMCKNIGKAE